VAGRIWSCGRSANIWNSTCGGLRWAGRAGLGRVGGLGVTRTNGPPGWFGGIEEGFWVDLSAKGNLRALFLHSEAIFPDAEAILPAIPGEGRVVRPGENATHENDSENEWRASPGSGGGGERG